MVGRWEIVDNVALFLNNCIIEDRKRRMEYKSAVFEIGIYFADYFQSIRILGVAIKVRRNRKSETSYSIFRILEVMRNG